MEQARTKQGGSVINFLIVGALLAVLVLGAIYVVQHRNKAPAAPNSSPSVAVNSGNPTAGNPSAQPSGSPTASPSASPRPSSSPQPSTSATPKSSTTPTPQSSAATGSLPATGPADDLIVASLPVAAITAFAVAYMQSRRAHRRATSY